MNKRGFTLIELLAVIVIMGLVLVIAIPTSINAYKQTKLKAEEGFINRLSESIDSYVSLNTIDNNISFRIIEGTFQKPEESTTVTVSEGTIYFNDIFGANIIDKSDFVNPNTKIKCDINSAIKVYKDSDFVYCHKITKDSALYNCLSDDYKLKHQDDEYIVDTCVWTILKEGE